MYYCINRLLSCIDLHLSKLTIIYILRRQDHTSSLWIINSQNFSCMHYYPYCAPSCFKKEIAVNPKQPQLPLYSSVTVYLKPSLHIYIMEFSVSKGVMSIKLTFLNSETLSLKPVQNGIYRFLYLGALCFSC